MANRYMQQFLFGFNHMLTFLQGNVAIGASGAVGALQGSGISSVVKNSTGNYTIVLEDKYMKFLSGDFKFVSATFSGVHAVEIVNANIDANVQDGTGINIVCYDASGVAANPASGSVLYFNFMLRNSSVKGKGE